MPFTDIDHHFADFMVRICGDLPPEKTDCLRLSAKLASYYTGIGHICIDMTAIAGTHIPIGEEENPVPIAVPELEMWVDALKDTPVVGKPGEFTPLILDDVAHRLYLYRYWHYEKQLAEAILKKVKTGAPSVDEGVLKDSLKRLFLFQQDGLDLQRIAAVVATKGAFSVISGGPGTGKTFTVAKILAILLEQAKHKRLAIALAAPTGKAAARLKAMIGEVKEGMNCANDIKSRIPDEASTIHRLLGPIYRTKRFRFNEQNPLPYDVVVIDEASMIDLPLMAKLFIAIPQDARLILLGDKDQLASVEPGAVFGDICHRGSINIFSKGLSSFIEHMTGEVLPHKDETVTPIADTVVVLQRSYRFGPNSGIRNVSKAVNAGEGPSVLQLLKEHKYHDICWRQVPPPDALPVALEENVMDAYVRYVLAKTPEEAFDHFNRFHILCALRKGPYGVVAVNNIIESMLMRRGVITRRGRWYRGQPIMITNNDYHLKLFNGDVGILFPDHDSRGELRVFFPTEDGTFRKILPTRLSEYETVYAITVHKSQGSEFNNIIVLLPDRPSEVVTRELIYTAITRAKEGVEIWGDEVAFCEAVARGIRRQSGLQDLLFKLTH